ncbi:MAG: CotH kinase family protein [Chitinophagaceae bacterium]|nr:CotH kinase family protein [Chitinophagaceae bacterium]
MKKILSFFILLCSAQFLQAQVMINEYSCSNTTTVLDAYNQRNDWMELYNAGGAAVNLTGYYLSDDPNNPMKWQIPTATPINPAARKMVYFSGRGVVHAGTGQIHPDFKLRQTLGEWIILSDPSGVLVDSVHLRITQRNHSWGRTTDASPSISLFNTPTPNNTNNTQTTYTGYASRIVFSQPAGFYTGTQNISLSTPDPNVTIRYTTNGTIPTAASTAYTAPIAVTATTPIRAVGFSSNPQILPSLVETNTYFINESSNFTVVSVCGTFTGAGSLFNGSNPTWSSFEYFTPSGTQILELEGGRASRHGNDSWAYPQKGIDFEAMDESGDKASFYYKLFGTTLRDTFDRIMLKAGGSDNYAGGPGNSAHLRDVFAQTLGEKYNLDMDFRRWHPCLMFVNGTYWGVYDMRERVDGDYFEYYYGKKKDKVDHLSYWGGLNIRMGSDTGWNNLYNYIMSNNMAVQANYDHVKQFLDVNSFCQYFVINSYLVNHDWLNWNTMWWRGRGNNNPIKWRYAMWDMDAITGLQNPNYTGLSTTSYQFDPCEPSSMFQNNSSIKHTDMLDRLLQNPQFEQTYKDNWLLMFNGPLDCANMLAHFDSIVNILTPEMNRQANAWGGTMAGWQANCTQMRTFLQNRCAVIGTKLDSCMDLNPQQLKLNVSPPNSGTITLDGSLKSPYVWSKVIEGDSIYTLKATPTGGAYWAFDHWEKQEPTNSMAPNMTTDLVQFDFKKKDSVIAVFKYYNYDSVDVTFDVTPPGTGTIDLNGTTISTYPTTIKLDRRYSYGLTATPASSHNFVTWQKNNANTVFTPNMTDKQVVFNYTDAETIVAEFVYVPPPPPPPPLPNLNTIDKTVFIPNAFTPNKDGKNDKFGIQVGLDATGLDMVLYDRWGKQVYQNTKLNGGWDGTYSNGKNADVGTYQYIIKVRFRDNSIETFKGDFTLIR